MRRFCGYLVLFIFFTSWLNVASAQVVNMPDANLRAAVRKALGLAPTGRITKQAMSRLTTLDAAMDTKEEFDFPISDLTGLEHATQLEELSLWQHRQIRDISPLAGLTRLRKLDIQDNIISDISPLAGLTQLRELHLGSNQISDISPLAGLTQLRTLALYRNQISDISPLAGLKQLSWLYLAENQIRDISPLAGLTQLRDLGFLGLSNNQISDLSPLASLTQLESLDLVNNQIRDVTPLVGLVRLKRLSLAGNPVEDVSPLATLTSLVEVDVEIPNQVRAGGVIADQHLAGAVRRVLGLTNTEPISKRKLQDLRLLNLAHNNQVSSLKGLEHATQLEALLLNRSQINGDISVIANFTQLKRLTLGDSQIRDISALANLRQLTELNLQGNEISDLTPLSKLTKLERLWLVYNRIADLSPLANLKRLTDLGLYNNAIRDVSPLSGLLNLQTLSLGGNPIEDASALANLPNLRDVDIKIPAPSRKVVSIPDRNLAAAVRKALGLGPNARITQQKMRGLTELRAPNSQIRDLTGLEHATQLTRLDLRQNQIRDLGPLTDLKKLWRLDLWRNQIRDIRPLAGLTNLTGLFLSRNQIQDLTPIAGLTELRVLEFSHNTPKIRGITPLEGLKQLKWLKLTGNQIEDISPLSSLTKLEWLRLDRNQIRDVSPLAGLVNLETLWLEGNPIQDTSPLSNLPNLRDVDINIPPSPSPAVSIPDPNLRAAVRKALGLGQNARITQPKMRGLTELRAPNSQIRDLTGLEHATQLTRLDLQQNQISNLSPLTDLKKLRRLALWENQIHDIRPLAGLTNLTELYLTGNQIRDITPITSLTKLRTLSLGSNTPEIHGITPLEGLKQLKWLKLSGNQISDVSPLAGLVNLETLYLNENPIEDMTPLRTLLKRNPDLELDIDPNQLAVVQVSASQRPPIYWVDMEKGTLHRLTGATVERLMPYVTRVTSLAVDIVNGKLYWTMKRNFQKNDRRGRIRRANLNGTDQGTLKELMHMPHGITLDVESDKIYLTNASGEIQELDFNGSNFQSNFITGLNSPKDLAVDGERDQLYWAEPDSIWRADLNGNNTEVFAPNLGELGSIAIAGSKIYSIERPGGEQRWQIRSSTFDGLTPPQTLVTLQSRPMGLAVDTAGGKLYWTNTNGKIQQANLNGGDIQDVVTGLKAPGDIVLGVPTRTSPAAPENTSLGTRQLPAETLLLANYPNPFNPETWIPYQLATDTDVQLLIYDAHGSIVRRLVLGHQRAGIYIDRSQAAYWDGRNTLGERVASGLYFYQLQTDNVSSLRKMLILK